MTNDTTESVPPPSRWLDALDDTSALETMAQDQMIAAKVVANAIPDITKAAGAVFERLSGTDYGRLIYTGAGTSARIGVQDGVELTPTFNWPQARTGYLIAGGNAALTQSIEGAEDNTAAAEKGIIDMAVQDADVVIGVAASGTTPFTCAAVLAAKKAGAVTIGIACNHNTPLLDVTDYSIALITGCESVAGSTRMKAGTAQKICLNMISTLVMVRMGKVKNGLMADMQATNNKLRERQKRIDALLGD